jgi:NAD(P)-dependent dehydrogenase (short-subunit alcohol dehydrogenase family)
MNRVNGKVAVVTGAALGIGRAAAHMLAKEGALVALTDVLDDQGRQTAQEIGENAAFWHLDVSKEQQVKSVFDEVAKKWGRIDILVNNAGISGTNKPTDQLTEAEWDQVMGVNVKGVFFCTKHAIPHMRAAGGSIINLSSIYGLIGAGDVPPYHASKGAVREMSKNDAILYAKEKIRVNSVHPGFIWTPMVDNFVKSAGEHAEEARKALDALHPLGHIGEADDIAWGILYLASDEAKFVTGTELVIDGGYTAR